jgi:hypothetical protein
LILASAASRNALGPSGVAATDPTLNDRLDDLVFAG